MSSYVWHDYFICETWLIFLGGGDSCYDAVLCCLGVRSVTQCVHMCDMTILHVRHDLFIWGEEIRVTMPCSVVLVYVVWHNAFILWYDSSICEAWLVFLGEEEDSCYDAVLCCLGVHCVAWRVDMRDMTVPYVEQDAFFSYGGEDSC